MDHASDIPSRRRLDGITAIMVVVTVASLVGAGWLRARRGPGFEPAAVGSLAPPLRLLDLTSSEPIVLVGLRGKVVWVVFWSADSPPETTNLAAFEPAWNALKAQGRFAMVAAAVEADTPERVRAVVARGGVKLPVYLATAESRRRFGALNIDTPLSVLIDGDGRIASLSRGTSPQTIDRIADQAGRLLDLLGPAEETRFAHAVSAPRESLGNLLP